MRQDHYTLTPAAVRGTAGQALRHALPVKDYGELVSARLPVPAVSVIVVAAAVVTTLASLLAARRAARVPILEATRAE